MEPRMWLGHDVDDGELVSVEEEEEEPFLQYFKVLLLYLFKAHRTGIRVLNCRGKVESHQG